MRLNKFVVSVLGDKVGIQNPPTGYLSREDALELAAWLVALSTLDYEKEFLPILSEITNS